MRYPIIQCPNCKWQTPKYRTNYHIHWECDCGTLWNTFATHGKCPNCGKVWKNTQCPKCKVWSLHSAWYKEMEAKEYLPMPSITSQIRQFFKSFFQRLMKKP